MPTITTECFIAAPPERIWDLTVDIEGWPALTPTITAVERHDSGPLAIGSTATLRQPGQRPRVWTVRRLEAPHEFAWDARLLGMTMTGTHSIAAAPGGSTNRLGLEVTGFGAGLFLRLAGRTLRTAIETENAGFKRAAEAAPV